MLKPTFLSDRPEQYPVLLQSDITFKSKVFWWEPHPWGSPDIFTYIDKDTVKGNFFIVVDCSPDPIYQDYLERSYLKTILIFFRENNISFKRLIVLTPSPDYIFIDKKVDYKHMFFSSFWVNVKNAYKKGKFTNSPKKIDKTFFTLMRRDTKPRCLLNYMLHKKKVHDKGFVTHNRANPDVVSTDKVTLSSMIDHFPNIDKEILKEKGLSTHLIDAPHIPTFYSREFTDYHMLKHNLHSDLSSKSLIEVVVETQNLDRMFFTEKTLKTFLAKNIFIVFNNQYSLKFLKGLGFKTFEGIIDERYDDISDMYDRASAICDEVKRLSMLSFKEQNQIYLDSLEIIEHNYNHYLKGDWTFNLYNRIERHIDETILC